MQLKLMLFPTNGKRNKEKVNNTDSKLYSFYQPKISYRSILGQNHYISDYMHCLFQCFQSLSYHDHTQEQGYTFFMTCLIYFKYQKKHLGIPVGIMISSLTILAIACISIAAITTVQLILASIYMLWSIFASQSI